MKSVVIAGMLCVVATCASAEPFIKVAAVQMRSGTDVKENCRKICRFVETLAAQGVKAAVFPECALTSYESAAIAKLTREDLAGALDSIAAACRKSKICAVVGTPTFRPDGKLWNSAVVFDPDGKIIERYHKVHSYENWSSLGDHLALFDVAGIKGTIIICHDERYPELVRLPVMAGARLVFYISCEGGVRDEHQIDPYRAQIQARATENGVYVVHANAPANDDLSGSHGQSRIIKPDGIMIREASMFAEELVIGDIDLNEGHGGLARKSLDAEFLKKFWEEGLKLFDRQ